MSPFNNDNGVEFHTGVEYESDDDISIIYEPEEISHSKYNLVLYEPYNSQIYGTSQHPNHDDKLLTTFRFKYLDRDFFKEIKSNTLHMISQSLRNKIVHPQIRNYKQILQKIKPEIAECYYSVNGECFCKLKTFWIKIIQRKWKKIMTERKHIFNQRCSVPSLRYRELYGKWPESLLEMPTIHGILNTLVRI
jgi:hypothetical protein